MARLKGGQRGNDNASKSTEARLASAIKKALKSYRCAKSDDKVKVKTGEALDRIGMKIVDMACHGKGQDFRFAVQTIGERLDGKPTEHKTVSIDSSNEYGSVFEAFGILQKLREQREDNATESTVSH